MPFFLPRLDLPTAWVDFFCRKTVDHWRNAENTNALSRTAQSHDAKAVANPLRDRLDLESLFARAYSQVGLEFSLADDAEFQKVFEGLCFGLSSEQNAPISPGNVLRIIDSFLGPVCSFVHWKDSPEDSIQNRLIGPLYAVARDESRSFADSILKSCGDLPGSYAAIQAAVENCLTAIRRQDEFHLQRQDCLREILSQSEQILTTQPATLSLKNKHWWQLKSSAEEQLALAPYWLAYVQRRRDLVVLQAVNFILQVLKAELCALNDRLRDLQHDLHRLGGCFSREKPSTDDAGTDGPEHASESDRRVINEFLHAHVSDLIRLCTENCGTLALMESKTDCSRDDSNFQVADSAEKKMRGAVERVLLSFLRPKMFQVWTQQASESAGKFWEELFKSARPLLDDCGGTVRMLVSAPEHLSNFLKHSCLKATGIEPTMLPAAEDQIFVSYELDQLSLPRVALHCLKDNRDLISLAQRLHTRIDVPWARLPGKPVDVT